MRVEEPVRTKTCAPEDVWRAAYGAISAEECEALSAEFVNLLKLLKVWHMEAPRTDPKSLWLSDIRRLKTSQCVRERIRLFAQDKKLLGRSVATYCAAPSHDHELLIAHERELRSICAAHGAREPQHLSDRYSRGQKDRPSWSYLWQLADQGRVDAVLLLTVEHIPGPDLEWLIVSRELEERGVDIFVADESQTSLRLLPPPGTAWQWLGKP